MKHALLSPSASHRWLACPGSVEANRGKKQSAPSFYSVEGTSAHALLEVCLRLGCQPEEFLGWKLERDLYPIDQAMVDGVEYALDYVRGYVANNPKTRVLVEQTVRYGQSIGTTDDMAFGHSDIILDNAPKEAVGIDYKHGIGGIVRVEENSQLRLYLLGIRQQRRYQRYRAVVVQPRVPRRKPVQEAPALTDAQLVKWADTVVRPVVPIALAHGAPRVAGEHCRYCAADGNCQAQYSMVLQKAKKEFAMSAPKDLTPAQIGELLDALASIEQIGKKIKEHAVAQIHAGVDIPGYVKDWSSPHRKWADDEEANEALAALGLEKRERYSVELLTPSKAEDVLKAKKLWPKKPRGSAGDDFTNPFQGLLAVADKKPAISKA